MMKNKDPKFEELIKQYKTDPDLVYRTWFINNEERLKAFRSIRRGVIQVIDDIKKGDLPNNFKGSSLEFVLNCITEQKQVFEGAAHPFYWKPKTRIPDIYENQENKKYFVQSKLQNKLSTNFVPLVPGTDTKPGSGLNDTNVSPKCQAPFTVDRCRVVRKRHE